MNELQNNEIYRMQMAAISVIALSNTKDSLINNLLTSKSPYWTPAYDDVVDTVRREILLIEKNARLEKYAACGTYHGKSNPFCGECGYEISDLKS